MPSEGTKVTLEEGLAVSLLGREGATVLFAPALGIAVSLILGEGAKVEFDKDGPSVTFPIDGLKVAFSSLCVGMAVCWPVWFPSVGENVSLDAVSVGCEVLSVDGLAVTLFTNSVGAKVAFGVADGARGSATKVGAAV